MLKALWDTWLCVEWRDLTRASPQIQVLHHHPPPPTLPGPHEPNRQEKVSHPLSSRWNRIVEVLPYLPHPGGQHLDIGRPQCTAWPKLGLWYRYSPITSLLQSERVPEIGTYSFRNISPVIRSTARSDESFTTWLKKVIFMLQGYNIANVVDDTIPRPFWDGIGGPEMEANLAGSRHMA